MLHWNASNQVWTITGESHSVRFHPCVVERVSSTFASVERLQQLFACLWSCSLETIWINACAKCAHSYWGRQAQCPQCISLLNVVNVLTSSSFLSGVGSCLWSQTLIWLETCECLHQILLSLSKISLSLIFPGADTILTCPSPTRSWIHRYRVWMCRALPNPRLCTCPLTAELSLATSQV